MTRASDTAKLLGAGATILDGTTISTADNTTQLTLTSTDADGNSGPQMNFSRASGSPADDDYIGRMNFIGRNDAGQDFTGVDILTRINDASDGTEDASFFITTMENGSQVSKMEFLPNETVFNQGGTDTLNFRIESADEPEMFIVNAANNTITMGTQTGSGALLHVINDSAGPFLTTANATAVFTGSADTGKGGSIGFDFGVPHTNYPVGMGYVITSQTASTKGDLAFGTRSATSDSAPTERLRIKDDGRICHGATAAISGAHFTQTINSANGPAFLLNSTDTSGNAHAQVTFRRNGADVGFINTTGSATQYSTSSDYRIKENVTADWEATTRLKQLNPVRFNFIADADTTVDGFLAHEVSSIVPEAVTGTKDATQDVGTVKDELGAVLKENVLETDKEDDETWTKTGTENVYQGIDQSKLVPLLVKTIQELEARITTLENA